ncbi:hypothetical protein EVAR_22833_1 [Eumeta japonica]|uniref:Uncharacterized protein n=1 Tax=Eumeta variegata TaxID=151549 RepID=A0A4C1VES9_EUMVA|nr:hypothetical protein EVAR_22833_1 [Eumeta japonica]
MFDLVVEDLYEFHRNIASLLERSLYGRPVTPIRELLKPPPTITGIRCQSRTLIPLLMKAVVNSAQPAPKQRPGFMVQYLQSEVIKRWECVALITET